MNRSEDFPGALINRNDVLLVLIDFQERLMPAIAHGERVIENAKKLLAFSRIIGLPVIVTEQEKLGTTLPQLKDEVPELQPISKVHFNCFYSDPFTQEVRRAGKKTLLVAGVEAHICVAQTALYAVPEFDVHVVADAISSRSIDNWTVAVERMRARGVTVTSTEMVIYELLQRAGTEEFKAALQLVK
jgi:nicotinamidase-related amidase